MPEREHLRRLTNVWTRHPLYFVTACTAHRQKVLTSPAVTSALIESWRAADRVHGWVVGRYVIMPDHVHFFTRPRHDAKPISAFMRDWKKWTTRQITTALSRPPPLWQPEFFDHLIRSATSYSEKWDYVYHNPVRAGLVATPEVWPHSGECESLTF